ncbi:MAG: hypothetical protein N2688_09445 [Burkholderiaceae bacterium]|nr:hypothetical protein [Burkholderiaceae bacterium]
MKAVRVCAHGFLAFALAACGGSNPFDNPPEVSNPANPGGRRLSFAYFQRCIDPIFNAVLANNTCAASGCHDDRSGTGGALRLVPNAATVDVTNPANTPEVIRNTDMYRNFYSAQGMTLINAPADSRLVTKPLTRGVLHGGGRIFVDDQDPNVRRILFWINNPAPQGQDEFSPATYNLFTPADPNAGACRTQ